MDTKNIIRLVVLPLLFVALGACRGSQHLTLRTMAGYGLTETKIDAGDGDEDTFAGGQGSLHIELARKIDYIDNVEAGFRILGGHHNIEEKLGDLELEMDSFDLGFAIIMRPYFNLTKEFTFYTELLMGYRHYWGESDLTRISTQAELASEEDDDGGALFGFGLGAEYRINNRLDVLLGLGWNRQLTEEKGVEINPDDFSALVGISWQF